MRRTFLVFSFIFSFSLLSNSCSLFAQEENKAQKVSSIEQSQEKAVNPTSPVQESAKIVNLIEVRGNKAISTNTIISKMKTRVGSPYLDTAISDDLKRLYLLGFFDEGTKIDSEPYKDGVKVIVTVVERPLIEKINFAGITHASLKDEKLKPQLKSKEGQYLDYANLTEDIRILKKLYEKIGFSQVQIDYNVSLDKETNKAKVLFNVVEGKKVRIQEIIISGNKSFKSARILRLLKTKRAWFFNAGVLKDDVIKEDMERLKTFYRDNGFSDVTLSYEVKPDLKKSYLLNVYINIVEGKKYSIGNVVISGNKYIKEKEIIGALKDCLPGKVFSQDRMRNDASNIQSLYFDRGYISCRVMEGSAVNAQTGRVDITYNIDENDVAYVSKIKVRGNVKTKDAVIRRELRIYPGDKFDGAKLNRSKERLKNLGYFEEVSYDTEDTQVPDKKDLIVDVKETKTGSFSFGGGYSTVDDFVGFAEIEQKNFDWLNWPYFTGGGQDLKFRGSFGTVSNSFELSFTNPWVFDYPFSFGFDLYKRDHKRDEDVGYGYDQKVMGGDLRLGKELTEYINGNLTFRHDKIQIKNISGDATVDLKKEDGSNIINSLTPSLSFDTRDNVFETRKGELVTGMMQYAGGFLGGDKYFWKFYGRASHYVPLPFKSVLELKGRVGVGDSFGNTDDIPIYERFFAGGADTIRGYEERKVGPTDPVSKDPLGGQSMLVGNIEYTYPLLNFLKVAGFYDVGNVWSRLGDIGTKRDTSTNTGGFKSGIGLGIRVKTPLGPMRLDYGIPMAKAPGEDKKSNGRFHFSASHDF
ncbi:MAG: outer membrane protein assembly factor BamA [Candidatus Omnitrophica bacterium]|nr:outer membrane protein assembly factor BamA [Candidatus Omnitrophota bacterium]